MKHFFIDVTNRSITEVNAAGLKAKQNLIGGYIEGAGYFGTGPKADFVYVDEEGMFKDKDFFYLEGVGQGLFRGDAVVVGSDGKGGDASCKSTLEELQNKVRFITAAGARALAATMVR